MFQPFPKLTRFSHDWTVTEKIDGTNAQILIGRPEEGYTPDDTLLWIDPATGHGVWAGSRNRLLTVGKGDNHGFAGFVQERAAEIVEKLGEGRHFGEWYGQGIGPRGYGVNPKRFALFNAGRWTGQPLPDRFDVVPILYQGYLGSTDVFETCLLGLKEAGSAIAPGFMNPEGIVMYHGPSRTSFKKTFDYDEAGKWAENQARKA
jgi:hypothetical protein